MEPIAWVDGVWLPASEAKVSILDRGYLFGDGVYEVLRGYSGLLRAADRHWARLARSLAELRIDGVAVAEVARLVDEGVARFGSGSPHIYLEVSRGSGPRRHDWDEGLSPALTIVVREAFRPTADEREGGVAAITTPDLRWRRRDIKSVNLLANVLAKQEARERGAYEAILFETDGSVTEGSSTSIYVVRDGTLHLPPNGPLVLPGVTRAVLLELAAALGVPVREAWFDAAALRSADEVLLSSTTAEVLGIVTVDGEPVGDGCVGPVTRRLSEAYERRCSID